MKGVILAGGLGTRLHLFTRRVANKHCALVYDRPMIEYPLSLFSQAGIKEIAVVLGAYHTESVLKTIGDGKEFGFDNVCYFFQQTASGIAGALKLVQPFVKDDDFTVILGDNFFEDDITGSIQRFEENESDCKAEIFLKDVPDPERFGIATLDHYGQVCKIVEKPKKPESNKAITGLYFFDKNAFKFAETLKPSARGELEITDILNAYLKNRNLAYNEIKGYWSDMGVIESLDRTATFVKENKKQLNESGRFKNYRFDLGNGFFGDYLN